MVRIICYKYYILRSFYIISPAIPYQGLVPSAALPKYFTSEWSFAQFRLQLEDSAVQSVVGFAADPGVLYVVTAAGSFYKACFDTHKGGQASQEAFFKFASQPDMSPLM
jgi:hypothetical protein